MSKYLITCGCGKTVTVEVGQAGEQVRCQCGATLDVPPLRKLRHLPTATTAVIRRTSTWTTRRGIIAACLILATVLAGVSLWNRVTEPSVAPFSADIYRQMVEERLNSMTPAVAWQWWVGVYRPLAEHGISEFQHPHAAAIELEVAERRFFQRTLLTVAAAFAVVAVVAAVWPRSAARCG